MISPHPLSTFLRLAALVLASVFAASSAFAQGGGTLVGSVVDAATGKYLEGAEVTLAANGQHVTTSREGIFEFRNVAPGSQSVTVNYQGLEAKTEQATVTAGQTSTLSIRLGSGGDVVKLGEFKVAGTKEGMAQAVTLQKMSINAKVVAAGDQYGDIAEGNAAEYLKFLPGVGIDYNANDARAATLRGMNTQFTNVTMNGNPIASATSGNLQRRFEFEQAAINNVETIEVIKTLTPEQQASSTAGDINFVSRSAFDREGSLLSYRVYFQALNDDLTFKKTEGWGQEKTRKILPGIDLNYAVRLSPNLGINVSYKNSQLFNDYPRAQYNWDYSPANGGTPTNPVLVSFALQNEQKDTRRQAFTSQIDYKLGEHTKLSALGYWAYYDLLFTDRVTTITPGAVGSPLATTSTPNTGSGYTGGAGKGTVAFQTINRWKSGVTWNFPLNLSHEFGNGSLLEASAYWSQAYSKYRDTTGGWYSDITVTRGGTNPATNSVTDPLTVTVGNLGSVVPTYRATDGAGAAVDLTDISRFVVTQIRSRPQTGVDTKTGYNADYKFNFKTGVPVSAKVGFRVDETTRNISNPIYNRTGTSAATGFGGNAITGAQLASTVDTGFSNHPIGYGLPAYNFISVYSAFSKLGGNSFLPYTPAADVQARFEDSTNSGYVRVDVTPLNNLILVGGLRYEDRQTDSQNRLLTLATPISAKFTDKSWFPSANLKYTLARNLIFRAGYSRSIGLPDYSDLLPGPLTIADPASGKRGTVSVYNPNLRAYKIDNYDAGVEYYFSRSGYVSATVFRKTLKNYIVLAAQTLDANSAAQLGIPTTSLGAPVDQYDVTTRFNVADPGHYNGVELGYAQNFSFLPKPFNTLGLQFNATLLSIDPIKGGAPTSADVNANRAIQDQIGKSLELSSVKEAFNVTLNYSIGKFGFTVTSNYTGHVLKVVTQKTVKYTDVAVNQYFNELQYQAPRELVDVRVDYKWSRRFTPYFQARNVFGRPIVQSTPTLPFNRAEYGDPIYELGVRGVW